MTSNEQPVDHDATDGIDMELESGLLQPRMNLTVVLIACLVFTLVSILLLRSEGLMVGLTLSIITLAGYFALGLDQSATSQSGSQTQVKVDRQVSNRNPARSVASFGSRGKAWIEERRHALTLRSVLVAVLPVAGIALFTGWLLSHDLDRQPPGFFTDEAEIGFESWKLLHGTAETSLIPFFYQHLQYFNTGTLPLFATAPFVGLFGNDSASVRLSSAFFGVLVIVISYLLLRRFRCPLPLLATATLLFSPLFIHISHTNFGHLPSLFLMLAGYWIYTRVDPRRARLTAIVAGGVIGSAIYGHSSFYIAAPFFVACIGLAELLCSRGRVRETLTRTACLSLGTLVSLVPVIVFARTNDGFWQRWDDKTTVDSSFPDDLQRMAENWGKYFSLDLLLSTGPRDFISRHAVQGAGLLNPVMLPLFVIGLIAMLVARGDDQRRYYLPFFLFAVVYPMPDLVSTTSENDAYTFSIVAGLITLPFISGYAIRGIDMATARTSAVWTRRSLYAAIALCTLYFGATFLRGPYVDYQTTSADYWGWQYGPEPAIAFYLQHDQEYEQFVLDPNFNGPSAFIDFLAVEDPAREEMIVGGLNSYDPGVKQLFAVRADIWQEMDSQQLMTMPLPHLVETIRYPDGSPTMYLMEFPATTAPPTISR